MSDARLSPCLSGLRVLDASASVAGQYCSKLLADFGADVQFVQVRGDPVLPGVDPNRARRWNHFLNVEKQLLELGNAAERHTFLREKLNAVDVVVENFADGSEEAALLDRLAGRPGIALRASVSSFGRGGPYSGWKSDELIEYAMGGLMYLAGDKTREPLLVPGMQGQLHAGLHLACGVVANLIADGGVAKGNAVEVTVFEAMMMAHNWTIAAWTHRGKVLHRDVSQAIQCRDGFMLFVPRSYNTELFLMIGQPTLLSDERFSTFPAFVKNYKQFWAIFEEWSKNLGKMEVWRLAQEFRIPCCPILSPLEILDHPQVRARQWTRAIGGTSVPGGAMRMTVGTGDSEHDATPVDIAEDLNRHPLTGVKVLEITSNWAGPLAARHLADLGATVVKIEFAKRPATRSSNYVGDDPQKYHYNRSGYFNKLNRNKLGISLDLAHPLGKVAFRKLVQWADVLVENNSPRVMRNWGFTREELWKLKPSLIIASISAFGSEGPISDYIAFGVNVEGTSGLASVVGYSNDEPFGSGNNHPDPVAGTFTALGMLSSLYASRVRGASKGSFLDVSIQEAGATFMAETFMEALDGVIRDIRPVSDDATTLREIVPCIGNDSWLGVAVRPKDNLEALTSLIGWDTPVTRFDEMKTSARNALHEAMRSWASTVDHREGAALLQGIGIAAGPVLKNWEILSDNHLNARGFFQAVSHAESGTLPFPGFPWRFSAYPLTVQMPAPLFAEHTSKVLQEFASLGADELLKLHEAGVTAGTPQQPVIA